MGSGQTTFAVCHGPEKLPSAYLAHMQQEGWVCLTSILAPEVVEGLERVAGTDRYEHLEVNNDSPKVCQSVSVGRAITEPVSLWLIRQYMRTRDLHLGHPPGFRVLAPDDGQSKVGGWHYDARTWHRAGINRSQHKRGAMLSSFQTVDVVPKTDTKYAYGRLLESPIYQELNAREQHEIADLFLNQPSVA